MTPSEPSPSVHDRLLGALTGTRLASAAARGTAPGAPGAEATLQLCVLDGLTEAAEWSAAGVGADDTACLWLGALRWIAMVDGAVPDGAPEPPARPVASAVASVLDAAVPDAAVPDAAVPDAAGSASRVSGGDPQNLIGLRSPEMSLPRRPWGRPAPTVPELAATDGAGVLARAAAIGLLAPAEQEDVHRLAVSAAALSHGSPAAHTAAGDAAAVMHAASRGVWAVRGTLSEVLGREHDVSSPSRIALQRALGSVGTVLGDLESSAAGAPAVAWEAVTRLCAEGDEGAALYAGALVGAVLGATALATAVQAPAEDELADVTAEAAARFAGFIA